MKRNPSNIILTILLLCVAPITVLAEEVEIDGIRYELINKGKQAAVISKDTKYLGDIIIPSTIKNEGIVYSVTIIEDEAFCNCSDLTSIDIPNSLKSIGKSAFWGCTKLSSITIPNSVTYISDSTFGCCFALSSFTIPSSVTSIGSSAFTSCRGLTSINIPNSVKSIGDNAFQYCTGLTSIDIPNSVTGIGYSAFYGCSSLKSVIIGNGITRIENKTFESCSSLTSVTIPSSVTSIGEQAFSGCSGLTSVHISDIAAWCKISFDKHGINPLSYAHHLYLNDEEIKDLVIPNSVISINKSTFSGLSSLTSVTIPNSVTSIGEQAFSGCTSLTSINIPNSVKSIGWYAFSGCTSLTSVTIPNSVTWIGGFAFQNCSDLTYITIGDGVQEIMTNAFANCENLDSMTIFATSVPQTSADAFDKSYIDYATLMVPDESIDAYKSTEPWSQFGTIKGISGTVIEKEKCATPTIHYADGKLTFECETEGATCYPTVTKPEVVNVSNNEMQLGTTYKVSVYAAKPGYEDSDVATAEINMAQGSVGSKFDVNNDGEINITDALIIIDIILGRYY